jgi:hypothetical protein
MRITEKILHFFIEIIVSHPRAVLLIFILTTGMLGWQAKKFKVDASSDTLLMRDNDHFIKTRVVTRRFSPREFLLIAYEPHTHPVISERTFDDLERLRERILRLDRVASVRSIINVPLFLAANQSLSAEFEPAEWMIRNRAFDLQEVRRVFTNHPIYENLLINDKQTATALQVLFKRNEELEQLETQIVELQRQSLTNRLSRRQRDRLQSLKNQAEPIERKLDRIRNREVERIRDLLEQYGDRANTYMGGVHVLAFQLIRIIKNDLIVFGGAIAGMICLILWVLFRRIRWIVIPMVCCISSVISTMGLFGLLGLKTTVISSNFIALQLIMTLAITIHLIVQYRECNAAHPRWEQARLMRETLRKKIGPCFYAGLTTSIGFGSLLFSGIQPVIDFGWMMIIAMFFAIVVSILLFPALMVMFPREKARSHRSVARRFVQGCAGVSLQHGAAVFILVVLVLAASVIGCLRLSVENSFIDYFRDATRVHRELTFIDREFGGSTPLDLVYTFPPSERTNRVVLAAKNVQRLQRAQSALNEMEAVGKILSLVNLTELARTANDNIPLTEYELTAVYWTLEDSLREDLLGAFFSPEHNQARISMRIQDTTEGLNRDRLLKQIRQELAQLGIEESHYSLTNLFILYQDILQRLFKSQITTLGIVYAALTLTFWLIFRSIKVALIGMVPNILSTALVLGMMGWLRIPLDLMTITIAAIAMGIAVDDTIHYTHRYLEEIEQNDAAQAVQRTHGSVGFAILYTSVLITLGFSLLAFSDFVPSVLFGLLTGLAMAAALLSDLCVLPALLHRFVKAD